MEQAAKRQKLRASRLLAENREFMQQIPQGKLFPRFPLRVSCGVTATAAHGVQAAAAIAAAAAAEAAACGWSD
eukprot:4327941-Prorocentrum_lima.AAC.1